MARTVSAVPARVATGMRDHFGMQPTSTHAGSGEPGQTSGAALATVRPTEREAFWFWLKLGFISFGGPAGQIAIMHDELVERRRWIEERRFLHPLHFCMALPGPEAHQLASDLGY